MDDLEHVLSTYGVNLLLIASVVLVVLAFISLKIKKPKEETKKALFISIILATVLPTLYLIVSTVYLNTISVSGGPVHWHADFEIWSCGRPIVAHDTAGKEQDILKDPKGWSNKIGTPTLHEHDDFRVHLEGVVVKEEDSSLGKFFRVIGGGITETTLTVPTTEGMLSAKNGDLCVDNKQPAQVQVFVYQTDKDKYYSQKKIANPAEYRISEYSQVPAGDCIIVEFDTPKERTDKLCRSYRVAEKLGKIRKSNIEIRNKFE